MNITKGMGPLYQSDILPQELSDGDVFLRRLTVMTDPHPLYDSLPDQTWTHIPAGRPDSAEGLKEQLIRKLVLDPHRVTWIISKQNQVVGTSSHIPVTGSPGIVEIGATYLSPRVWGTGLNSHAKNLMIEAAFAAGAQWIQFRTDERNARSIRAIQKLGAGSVGTCLEDIMRLDGSQRTSLLFRLEPSSDRRRPTKSTSGVSHTVL